MELTPPKLTKLKPFLERICEEVYGKHPALQLGVFEKRPFGRNLYFAKCMMCGQIRILDRKHMQILIDSFREKGKSVGFMFPIDINDSEDE